MMTGSGIDLSSEYDCTYFTKSLSKMKKIDEDTDSKDRIKVFAFDAVNSRELTFDTNHGMPFFVRGFFRDKTVGGELGRSHFPLLNFESKTEWECLEDEKTYVPTKVDNIVHRTSHLKNASSRHVQLVVATMLRKFVTTFFLKQTWRVILRTKAQSLNCERSC